MTQRPHCQTFYLQRQGHSIFCHQWHCRSPARANILILHGMGEHGGRYGELAAVLNDAGFNVLAPDQRGHGRSLHPLCHPGDLGFQGWRETLRDVDFLHRHLAQENQLPTVLLGHSMGAILAQQYICETANSLSGAVLSGSPGAIGAVGAFTLSRIARFDAWRFNPGAASPVFRKNLFARKNRSFKSGAKDSNDFAWLSRDSAIVRDYVKDPFCGAVLSAGGLADMFISLYRGSSLPFIRKINKTLPLYVFSGEKDPVHNRTLTLRWLIRRYRKVGLDAQLRLYSGGRHEMLNETNRQEVYRDLIHFLDGLSDD